MIQKFKKIIKKTTQLTDNSWTTVKTAGYIRHITGVGKRHESYQRPVRNTLQTIDAIDNILTNQLGIPIYICMVKEDGLVHRSDGSHRLSDPRIPKDMKFPVIIHYFNTKEEVGNLAFAIANNKKYNDACMAYNDTRVGTKLREMEKFFRIFNLAENVTVDKALLGEEDYSHFCSYIMSLNSGQCITNGRLKFARSDCDWAQTAVWLRDCLHALSKKNISEDCTTWYKKTFRTALCVLYVKLIDNGVEDAFINMLGEISEAELTHDDECMTKVFGRSNSLTRAWIYHLGQKIGIDVKPGKEIMIKYEEAFHA